MEVDLAVLADAANKTDTGKLNILGIFDRITLGPQFPAASPTFVIIVRVVLHPSELKRKHQLLFRLADEDGKEIAKVQTDFEVGSKQPSPRPARVPIILGVQVTFPAPGEYACDILLDGRWETSMPLEVLRASKSSSR